MNTATRPQPLARPQQLQRTRPAEPIRSAEAARRLRVSKAHRAYVLAQYEWLRLRAVEAGFRTGLGHTPLPLTGNERLEEIGTKTRALIAWLSVNESPNHAEATPAAAPTKMQTSDTPAHVREFIDLATSLGLSHAKESRVARLAAVNRFLMDNEKEPIESIRSIREEDWTLLKAGLQRRLLRWP